MSRAAGPSLGLLAALLACGRTDSGPGYQWPNEPPGYTLVTDQPWSDVGSRGWGHSDRASGSRVIVDITAPFRPPNTLVHEYPEGFEGGREPAVDWYPIPDAAGMFVGFWWRPSTPWQPHGVVNKLTFITQAEPWNTGATSNTIVAFGNSPFHPGTDANEGPWVVRVALEFTASNGHLPNSNGDDPGSRNLFGDAGPLIHQGDGWHLVELLVQKSTSSTSQDGMVRWWVDGQLAGDYTTVNFDERPFREFQVAPTWGGVGGAKKQHDYLQFGPIRLSQP